MRRQAKRNRKITFIDLLISVKGIFATLIGVLLLLWVSWDKEFGERRQLFAVGVFVIYTVTAFSVAYQNVNKKHKE